MTMCEHYRWPYESCGSCNLVSHAVASRLRTLEDLPLRSSWEIDAHGYIERTDVKERRRVRTGRVRQREVIRERIATVGTTTLRSYSMEEARAELKRRMGQ